MFVWLRNEETIVNKVCSNSDTWPCKVVEPKITPITSCSREVVVTSPLGMVTVVDKVNWRWISYFYGHLFQNSIISYKDLTDFIYFWYLSYFLVNTENIFRTNSSIFTRWVVTTVEFTNIPFSYRKFHLLL